MIINNIGINFAGGGGGKSAVLETKDYAITANGTTSIEPSEGVDGISGGTISVNVQPSLTSVTYTENGTYTPGSGVDGFNSVTVAVPETTPNRLNLKLKNQLTSATQSDFDGVKSIPAYAFYGSSNLKTVNLPTSVTGIGTSCFATCDGLETINLDNVRELNERTFQHCISLTSVTLNPNIASYQESMPGYLFIDCSGLTSLDVPYKALTTNCFENCTGLTSITFTNNVVTVADGTYRRPFRGCTSMQYLDFTHNYQIPTLGDPNCFTSFTANYEIRVPQSLYESWTTNSSWMNLASHIVAYPDVYPKCKAIYTSTGSPITSILSNGAKLTSDWDGVSSGWNEYYGGDMFVTGLANKNITSLVLSGSGVTTVGYQAFNGATNLTAITLCDSVKTINEQAFRGCTALTSIDLSSVTSIGVNAFQNCSGLTSVDISSVTTLSNNSFFNCNSLPSITLPASLSSFGNYSTFQNCSSLTSVTINCIAKLPSMYFRYNTNLKEVTFGPQVSGIPANLFVVTETNTQIDTLTFQGDTPPTAESSAFYGFRNVSGTIYVPAGSVSAYEAWKPTQLTNWTVQAIS